MMTNKQQTIKITGKPNQISEALNRVDSHYFLSGGFDPAGRSVFTIVRPSIKNTDGTITSFFYTFLYSATFDIGIMSDLDLKASMVKGERHG